MRRVVFLLFATLLVAALAAGTVQAGQLRAAVGSTTSPDGVRIVYEVHGTATTGLVFVHGWSCDRSYWSGQLKPFSDRFTVVAMDLAGHGESGLGRTTQSMSAFGDDVAAVVEKIDLRRVVLIGHSMGGDVVLEAARRLKERVAGLIWVDTYKDLSHLSTPEQIQAFAAKFRGNFSETTRSFVRSMFPPTADKALVERIASDMASAPENVAIPALEAAFAYAHEVPAVLKALQLPLVAINPGTPPTNVENLRSHGVDAVLMPGVGHFLMMEDPATFNRLLEDVLAKMVK